MSANAILKLQSVGFTAEQVGALAELVDSQAATKPDLEAVEHRLECKIAGVESRLEAKIADIKLDIARTHTSVILWLIGTATVGAAIAGFVFKHIP